MEINIIFSIIYIITKIISEMNKTFINKCNKWRRPDGITTFPWKHGKCLIWDATVVDSFSKSHIIASSIKSGSSAKSAEILKSRKYQNLVGNFHYQPVAFETTSCCKASTSSFVDELGRKVIEASGDSLEAVWLRQKISLAIARAMLPAFFPVSVK